jgi:hypothetical protein
MGIRHEGSSYIDQLVCSTAPILVPLMVVGFARWYPKFRSMSNVIPVGFTVTIAPLR